MTRRPAGSFYARPLLVGAVTVLATCVAVVLAWNANSGLPFVPTFDLKASLPNAAQLVPGDDVREGGHRIGTVTGIRPLARGNGRTGAELALQLDKTAAPLPADSTITIRPRSALGLKYVELERGSAADTLDEGATIVVSERALAPELQEFFNLFDRRTRANVRANVTGFGNGLAARGVSLNRAFAALPRFLRALPPVTDALRAPPGGLARFIDNAQRAARLTAPLAGTVANGFAAGAQTFGALARDPQALRQTIAETPLTLETGTTALRNTRPFLRSLTGTARSLRLAATELRRTAPPLTAALGAGLAPLRATPPFSARLRGTFVSLEELARSPGSDMGVAGLDETLTTLRPLTRFLGPYATVCNYWNYTWSNLSEHITDRDQTGEVERIRAKNANGTPQAGYAQLGQAQPVPGYHNEFYSHAVTRSGEADCEGGQRGYLYHVAKGIDPSVPIAIDPHTPGVQGTTFTGRPRVPRGETFTNR